MNEGLVDTNTPAAIFKGRLDDSVAVIGIGSPDIGPLTSQMIAVRLSTFMLVPELATERTVKDHRPAYAGTDVIEQDEE